MTRRFHYGCILFLLVLASLPAGAAPNRLSSLAIQGQTTVPESTTANYTAIAAFTDGSQQTVTSTAGWSVNSSYATISGGVLTANAVNANQKVTITASYRSRGVTKTAALDVTITNGSSAVLSSLAVAGPATVAESSSANYTATATFSDGSTRVVTSTASWSESSSYATIDAGVLTTSAVTSDQTVTITASYTSGGISKTGSLTVTIQNSAAVSGSHAGRFSTYNGTATCLGCHASEAQSFQQSVHYQWLGDAAESTGLNPGPAGKLGGINDFCIYPDINWIGKMTNLDGASVDGGCARCHAGLGAKPAATSSQAQLENIDCLFCHSAQYKRTVQLGTDGQYHFVPDTANMTVSLLQAAVDITRPTAATCLKCHATSGGGNNFKRGDLEQAHASATRDFDFHMASTAQGGAGLSCLSCHTSVSHSIAGRGIDLRERDVNQVVVCTNCHSTAPHTNSTNMTSLNKHTARVNCTVCHIPAYAKIAPTDMMRDWSAPGDINPATRLFEPHMTMRTNVTPVYGFFNGKSQFYQFGSAAVPGPNGKILMAGPLGGINDPGAKIQAMKHHDAKQPIDPATHRLLPLKIGIFFQTGDVATAVAQGAAGVGWAYSGHQFVATERYMGLYHEVAPREQALACTSCHGGTRMNFAALGYTPLATRNGQPLCSSCHSARTASFNTIHSEHDSRFDCSTCHIFSKAN